MQKAFERLAEEAGETKWVLSTMGKVAEVATAGLRVAKAEYSDIDQDAWKPASVGRRSFGKFNKELEVYSLTINISLIDFMTLAVCLKTDEYCSSLGAPGRYI